MPEIVLDRDLVMGLAVALGAGLLIGVEREQRKADHPHSVAGVRTFALIALCGAVTSQFGIALLCTGAVFVGLAALVSYVHTKTDDPGLTTEVAMFAVYVLGALAMRAPVLSASLAVVVALLLALKAHLHVLSREILSAQELRDGLLLIASALIVLPLLPDRAVDPWQVLNPHKVWRVVVLVMAINALGYVAQRLFGPRVGLPVSGFAGGFVSSTATIGSMGQRAAQHPEQLASCVAAAALSNVATIAQMALLLAALSPPLARHLALPMIAAGVATTLVAGLGMFRVWREPKGETPALRGRPFEPRHALVFAALVTGILLASAIMADLFGDGGVLVAASLAGFADVHAAAASVAQVFAVGQVDERWASWAILLGLACNTGSKLVVATATGGRAFTWRLLPTLVALLVAFSLVVLLDLAATP